MAAGEWGYEAGAGSDGVWSVWGVPGEICCEGDEESVREVGVGGVVWRRWCLLCMLLGRMERRTWKFSRRFLGMCKLEDLPRQRKTL
jgi:hypothetical protein